MSCADLQAQWEAAVRANSRSRSNAVHARASAAGCSPNRWVSPRNTRKVDTSAGHEKGSSCSMSQLGTVDAAGNVCTQDKTDDPHWN